MPSSHLFTQELWRVIDHYSWNPRIVDELYLPELIEAHAMIPRLRRERIRDMAQAMRIARQNKDSDYKKAMKDLER